MATLLNTLLVSLFPALFGAHHEEQVIPPSEGVEITVKAETETTCDLKIYFYQSV